MKNQLLFCICFLFTCIGCNTGTEQANSVTDVDPVSIPPDTIRFLDAQSEKDVDTAKLQPIRKNFNRINAISNWSSIETTDLWETAEGGEATYYHHNNTLEKIVTRQFGETFQMLTEYYLLKEEVSFVYQKFYKYNRPIFYDSTAMKKNNDTEAFNFDKSHITETRTYFNNGEILFQIRKPQHDTEQNPLEDKDRIQSDFDNLLKLLKNK